jgi:hypothetical protein
MKQKTFRSRKWLAVVGCLEQCVLCGAYGTQVAHRNEGKGCGLKCDDSLTAALCITCHHEIDNGKNLTREERRALMNKAIVETLKILSRRGLVSP